MTYLTKKTVARRLAEPNGGEKILKEGLLEAAFPACCLVFEEDHVPAAAALLCRAAKRKEFLEKLIERYKDNKAPLYDALKNEQPKLRKNTAQLIGLLGDPADCHNVIEALKVEQTRFARPSMILSIGMLGGEEAKAFLESYKVPEAAADNEQIHYREESHALRTAQGRFFAFDKHNFLKLPVPCEIELRSPEMLSRGLAVEMAELGYRVAARHYSAVRIHTDDISRIYKARCFTEMLFVISIGSSPTAKDIAFKAKAFFNKILIPSHDGNPPFGFRVEVKGTNPNERVELVRDISAALSCDKFKNSTSNYDVELRVELQKNGSANLYMKLYTIPDTRFDYRKNSIPASMHPVTAAAIIRYAELYLKKGARVLDPCCGSGTFLLEREKYCECASLTGVDITHKTIDIARENAQAAGSNAKFIANDCLRFVADRPYDEVIANLPFGNRVGSHEDNTRLYAGILDKLPRWMPYGGVAVLYTMEYTLLKKLIRERGNLRMMSEVRTEAGGLMPAVFIIKVSR